MSDLGAGIGTGGRQVSAGYQANERALEPTLKSGQESPAYPLALRSRGHPAAPNGANRAPLYTIGCRPGASGIREWSMPPTAELSLEAAFGLALRAAREARGYSQEELAHRSELHRTFVSQIERGPMAIAPGSMERLALALDLALEGLISDAERRR